MGAALGGEDLGECRREVDREGTLADTALAGRDGHGIADGSRGGGITSQISPGGSRCGGRRLRRSD